MAPDDGYTRITLRIPNSLHGRLTAAAASVSHSMNGEIVQRLERSFEAVAGGPSLFVTVFASRSEFDVADLRKRTALAHELLKAGDQDGAIEALKPLGDVEASPAVLDGPLALRKSKKG